MRTATDIYSHAIRGKDHAAAQCWDDIMQRSRVEVEKTKTVNYCIVERIAGPSRLLELSLAKRAHSFVRVADDPLGIE